MAIQNSLALSKHGRKPHYAPNTKIRVSTTLKPLVNELKQLTNASITEGVGRQGLQNNNDTDNTKI